MTAKQKDARPKPGEFYLAIWRCRAHGYWSISLDAEWGGQRLTSSKCCGAWSFFKRWRVNPAELITQIQEATRTVEELNASVAPESPREVAPLITDHEYEPWLIGTEADGCSFYVGGDPNSLSSRCCAIEAAHAPTSKEGR